MIGESGRQRDGLPCVASEEGTPAPVSGQATDTIADTPYVLTAARSARVRVGSDPLYLEVNQLSLVDGAFDPGQMWANETGVLGG